MGWYLVVVLVDGCAGRGAGIAAGGGLRRVEGLLLGRGDGGGLVEGSGAGGGAGWLMGSWNARACRGAGGGSGRGLVLGRGAGRGVYGLVDGLVEEMVEGWLMG